MSVSVDALLAELRQSGAERGEASTVACHVLGRNRAWLLAHGDAPVEATAAQRIRELGARLRKGEPMAYLTGQQEFHGLSLHVSPDVLVPRPDTEVLVDWALELLQGPLSAWPAPRVLDLGTGSGAIALAVKHRYPGALVTAHDESPQALAVARHNARQLGLDVAFHEADWFERRDGEATAADLVVSNPPYIAADDPHLPALASEPRSALVAGPDGLDDLAAIVTAAPRHLVVGGWLLLEHGFEQGPAVRTLFDNRAWSEVATRRDLGGRERCTGGRLKHILKSS